MTGNLVRAALLRFVYDAAACLLLALPLRNATAASGIAALPDAARAFHLDGGLWLLEVLYSQRAGLLASVVPVLASLLLLSWLALLPEWWLLRVLAGGGVSVPAGRTLTRLNALALGTWAVRGAVWLLAALLASFVRAQLQRVPDERVADLAAVGVLAAALLQQLAVSLLRDLVAVRLVHHGRRVLATLRESARLLRDAATRPLMRYGAYRALSFGALLGAHMASVALDRNGLGGTALLAVLLGLAARVALETSWLRWLGAQAG
jgi:hypothetical protein